MGTIDSILKGAEFLRKADKIEEYKQILELLEERPKFLEQIANLKEENQNLKGQLKNKEEVVKGKNCYVSKDGTDKYCMRCFDKNKELIRLKSYGHRAECPECKNIYKTDGSDPTEATVFYPRSN